MSHFCPNQLELLQEGGPLPGSRSGACLTFRNELSQETDVLTKRETLLGNVPWAERAEGKGTLKSCPATWLSDPGFGVSFPIFPDQSCWHGVLPGGTFLAQPRRIPARQILGGWQDICTGVSSLLLTFSKFSQLVAACSAFLPGTSCCKITHARGSCWTWPGWAVLVSSSPNRVITGMAQSIWFMPSDSCCFSVDPAMCLENRDSDSTVVLLRLTQIACGLGTRASYSRCISHPFNPRVFPPFFLELLHIKHNWGEVCSRACIVHSVVEAGMPFRRLMQVPTWHLYSRALWANITKHRVSHPTPTPTQKSSPQR